MRHLSLALLAVSLLIAGAAHAEQRTRNFNITNDRGTYSGETTITRGDNSHTRDTTITGPGGKTATRSATTTRNEDGSINRSVTRTGPQGGTVSREAVISPRAADGSRSVQGTRTGRDGSTRSFQGTVGPRQGGSR